MIDPSAVTAIDPLTRKFGISKLLLTKGGVAVISTTSMQVSKGQNFPTKLSVTYACVPSGESAIAVGKLTPDTESTIVLEAVSILSTAPPSLPGSTT